ncbi:MAG: tetratricopeptide repeat protein [Bacteroidota bacterium]
MDAIQFGEWLRTRRRMLDLTQQAFADEVGCARVTLRRIESGALKPSKELARMILTRLEIPDDLQETWIRYARGLSPLPAANSPATNLPAPNPPTTNLPNILTSFIGREKELEEVTTLLGRHQLLTLMGPGGIGKTRFSIQVAQAAGSAFPDGVWMVELASIHDPLLVARATAAAIGLRDEPRRPVIEMLCDYLRNRKMLILLDNCEHLVAACAQLADSILRAAAHVRLLASSREALNIGGEITYPLPPLALPAMDKSFSAQVLHQAEAARLFIDRAKSALPSFLVTDRNAAAIAQICRHLDGIPLAIELAASKIRVLSPEQIEQRLDDRFRLLTGGSRTVMERHQTLRAAIDWSYNLLPEAEQALFRRLAIFVRSWSLQAAEAVCDGLEPGSDILHLLEQLINKSMIQTEEVHGELRYHMLETMRQYAYEKLVEAGELDRLSDRHLATFLDLAEQAAGHLVRLEQLEWLERLDVDYENVRAALVWSLGMETPAPALRVCTALGRYWLIRGYWKEGSWWLEGALEKPSPAGLDDPGEKAARLRALCVDADLADHLGNLYRMEASAWEALRLCSEETDRRDAAIARFYMGLVYQGREDNQNALHFFEQSLADFHDLGEPYWEACAFRSLTYILVQRGEMARDARDEQNLWLARRAGERLHLAKVLFNQATRAWTSQQVEKAESCLRECEMLYEQLGYQTGKVLYYQAVMAHLNRDFSHARVLYERVKDQSEFLGDRDRQSLAITNLGVLAREQGDLATARAHIEQALRIAEETGSKHDIGYRLALLSEVEFLQGDRGVARNDLRRSLSIAGELTDRRYTIGNTLLIFSNIFIHLAPRIAIHVFGATHAYLQEVDEHLDRFFLRDSDRVMDQAHKILDDLSVKSAFAQGQKLSLSEALKLALTAVDEM